MATVDRSRFDLIADYYYSDRRRRALRYLVPVARGTSQGRSGRSFWLILVLGGIVTIYNM